MWIQPVVEFNHKYVLCGCIKERPDVAAKIELSDEIDVLTTLGPDDKKR